MMRRRVVGGALLIALLVTVGGCRRATVTADASLSDDNAIPTFRYDPTWPKTLPNHWITGAIGALAVDAQDHVWVLQRPSETTNLSERYGLEGLGECCFPAPPVLEFDQEGNLVQSWGPIHGAENELLGVQVGEPYAEGVWPMREHGIFVDYKDTVWVDTNRSPSQLVRFSRDGKKVLLRIGHKEATSINDTMNLAGPTGIVVDPKTNEVFVADGYRNRRVIVFDAETGAYKRHWGAYGRRPPDGPQGGTPVEGPYDPNVLSQHFATVHCLVQAKDGLLYVCDRVNNRFQVFRPDGTYVNELVVAKGGGFGAVHALGLSPDQRFIYVADGQNKKVWNVRRADLKIVGSFSSGGRNGGQILVAHALAVDSKGNVYVGETINGNRVQRFNFTGMQRATTAN